ncbi:MAG: hypothetical protein LC746_18510, partial [Acidobacteria bacterium]|nr:hypothetical protein [Acidobacteriota bacterium]
NQRGRAVMPSTSLFTARGAYRVEGRVRGLRLNFSGTQMLFELFKPATEQEQGKLYLNGANQLIFSLRGSQPIVVSVPTDFLFRAQFDQANSRATLEVWNLDGTTRRASVANFSDATNFQMGGAQLTVAANYYGLSYAQCRMDWLRMLDGAAALGSPAPADTPPAGVTQLWRYEFEDSGADSSGNNITLTLDNAPLFENTPGAAAGSTVVTGAKVLAPQVSGSKSKLWKPRKGG